MSEPAVRAWPITLRAAHWGAALALSLAILAPKPEEGEGLLHAVAGSLAGALILARLVWKLVGRDPPSLVSALRLRWPPGGLKNARQAGLLAQQGARFAAALLLAAIPLQAGLGFAGVRFAADNAVIQAHETLGLLILVLAGAHVAMALASATLAQFPLVQLTLFGAQGRRALTEDSAAAALIGVLVGALFLFAAWGPLHSAEAVRAFAAAHEHDIGEPKERED